MCYEPVKRLLFLKSLVILFSFLFEGIFAHVSLTFPPARNYDLDFLDNIRTQPPCGMPRGMRGTTIMAGVQLNVSWHLAYPHRGGYRLELLDKNENFVMDLIKRDKSQTYIQGDPTAQWHTITIPKDLLCDTCTIRLLRQASEWANEYRFYSCADVRIVQPSTYVEDCSRHGQVILVGGGDGCKCYKGWWGPRCQYEEECHSDVDCGRGICVDLGGTALPRKQCFCPPGLHGMKCSKTNAAKLATRTSLDVSSHKKKKLSDKMTLHYKIISDEIEFVLMINGTSYGAIGWRPVSFNKSCQLWPQIEENKHIKRVIRQTAREKLVYRPNPTLLRPLNELQRSRNDPNDGLGRGRKPTLEEQYGYSNAKNKEKSFQSLPQSESKPEPEIEPKIISQISRKTQIEPPKPEREPMPESEPKSEPENDSTKSNSKPRTRQQSNPSRSPIPEPESEPEPESHHEKSAHAKPEPEHHHDKHTGYHKQATAEPEPENQNRIKSYAEPEPESHHDRKPHAEPEPEGHHGKHSGHQKHGAHAEPEPEKHGDSKVHAEPEPEANHDKHRSHHKQQPHAEPEPEKHINPKSHAEPEPESRPESSSEPEPSSEPEAESSSTTRKKSQKSQYAPKGDFYAMDCTDIIIGAARSGVYSRILDYYTRDRSTPRLDEFWSDQGTNSITSATGWQTGGVTVLIFRRKIKSTEPTDHDIQGGMHVIWARGQERGGYVHSPHSGLEKESPSIPNFYSEDEIKYHGHKDQRGSTFIEF